MAVVTEDATRVDAKAAAKAAADATRKVEMENAAVKAAASATARK